MTERRIKFCAISGVRGIYEEGMKEELTRLVSAHKIKEFSSKHEIPESTTKRLRKNLGVTRKNNNNNKKLNSCQLIKLSD